MNAEKQARSILVPLDGTMHATEALPVAKTIAELENAEIHVVHVSSEPLSPSAWKTRWPGDDAISHAIIHTRQGDPAEQILGVAEERKSHMIVMCTHTGLPKPEGAMGSVADRVFRNSPCPVILVRPLDGAATWRLRTVLLPHDASPAAAAAIEPARRMVERAGAKLIVLHIRDLAAPPSQESGSIPTPQYVDQPQYEWPSWAREFLDRLGRETDYAWLYANVRLLLGEGEPADAILSKARENGVDLIICAWRGSLEPHHAATIKRIIGVTML